MQIRLLKQRVITAGFTTEFLAGFLSGFLSTTLLFSASGLAYIPPSQYIIKSWVKKHAGVKRVKIKSRIIAYEKNKATHDFAYETLIYDLPNGLLRSTIYDSSNRRVSQAGKNMSTLGAVGKLLLDPDSRDLTATLKSVGVPIKTDEELLTLPTEEDRIASEILNLRHVEPKPGERRLQWVIGNQLWFEKDTFKLYKFSFSPPGISGSYDVLFDTQFHQEYPYPTTIWVNQAGGETLFAVQLLEFNQTPGSEKSDHPTGGDLDGSMKKVVQIYDQLFR